MNLRQIEVFRAVMLGGSVTNAARFLNVSQPGISRMLTHIEAQLGIRLFDRRRGKLNPTPEAHALQQEIEHVYRGVRRIDDVAQRLKDGARLSLRVLASPGASLDVVPSALSRLVGQFPSARVYMETVLVRDMTGLLARNEADVAISTLPVAHAVLASERVGRWSLACVFPRGHRLERKPRVALRDLVGERLIAFGADTPQGRMLDTWRGDHSAKVQSQIEVRSGQVACSLVAKGAGVAIVDTLTAGAWPDGRIAFRPLSGGPSFEIFAVSNASVPRSLLLDAFVRLTVEELRAKRSNGDRWSDETRRQVIVTTTFPFARPLST